MTRMIDEIDRKLIVLLQENARYTNAELAEVVGLTVSSVHERVKKLERKGIIKGYVALVDARALGKPITAFIQLRTGASRDGYSATKVSMVSFCDREPDVLECHHVAGQDCYILKVRATSPQHLENLIERIRSAAPVAQSVTNIALSTSKETSLVMPDGEL